MDLRETALLETSGTLGNEVTADTLQFAGVDSSFTRRSYEEFEDEFEGSESHSVDEDSTVNHGDMSDVADEEV